MPCVGRCCSRIGEAAGGALCCPPTGPGITQFAAGLAPLPMQARRLLNVDRVEKWFARAFTKDLRPAAVAVTINSPGEGRRLPPRTPSRFCTPGPGQQTQQTPRALADCAQASHHRQLHSPDAAFFHAAHAGGSAAQAELIYSLIRRLSKKTVRGVQGQPSSCGRVRCGWGHVQCCVLAGPAA